MNPNQPHIKTLLKGFETLNAELIGSVMSDSERYDDNTLSKTTFVSHLKNLFEDFKNFGNSKLVASESICSKDCGANKGCGGFVFTGSKSGHYCSFVVKTDSFQVTDIIKCHGMVPETETNKAKKLKTSSKYGPSDYKRLPPQRRKLVQSCEKALEELQLSNSNSETKNWLDTYSTLKEEISFIDSMMLIPVEEFENLYRRTEKQQVGLN